MMNEMITEDGTVNIIIEGTKYYDVSTCQNSNENCICLLKDDGIELPIGEDGVCTTQFHNQLDCDSFM